MEDDHFSGEEEDGEHWAQPVIITDDSLIVFENNDVIEKQPSEEDEKTFEVRVNEKEVHLFDESELENTLQIKTNKKEAFTSFLVDLTDQDVENSVEDEIPETQVEIPPKVDYFNHPLLSKQFSNADEIEKPEPLIRILVNEKEAFSPEVDEAPTNVDGNVFSKFDNKPNEIKTFVPTPVPRKAKPAPEDTPPLNRQLSSSAIVPKKSDNTLIKKIYSNPVVRNFALTNREQIPGALEEPKLAATNGVATVPLPLKKTVEKTEAIKLDKKPFAIERKEDVAVTHNFSLEFSDNESVKEQDEGDIDFRDLKERRLVANLLGKFSQSVPSLVKTPEEDGKKEIKERFKQNRDIFTQPEGETNRETEVSYFASVKKLRQLFENNDASRYKKDKPVHSLTARSISKEMKDKLSSRDGDPVKDEQPENETFC